MKDYIDGLLIVEGRSDASLISSFVDAQFVVTNGYDIPKSELAFINRASSSKIVFLLTDPDEAGEQIRERIHESVPNVVDLRVEAKYCDKKHKHGVAECSIFALKSTLKPYFSLKNDKNLISHSFLYECGIVGDKKLRDYVGRVLNLGITNNKTFLSRLNFLEISEKEILEVISQYGNK